MLVLNCAWRAATPDWIPATVLLLELKALGYALRLGLLRMNTESAAEKRILFVVTSRVR
jgi:hypothetical protein